MPIVKLCVHKGVILSLYPELPEGVTQILLSSVTTMGFPEQISGAAWMLTEFNLLLSNLSRYSGATDL